MEYITLLQAVPQFHAKLDELKATGTANTAVLQRMQDILVTLVKEVGDLSNQLYMHMNTQGRISSVEKRLDAMLIDAGKGASSRPANA
jgi:hypothetical protein